jgi:hypothetical protein
VTPAYDPTVPPLYFDTETVGLHGPIALLQYAIGDGPIHLVEVWKQPIRETLDLYRMICEHPGGVVGFNLTFDWFHICQQGTTLLLMDDPSRLLIDCVEEYAIKESEGRDGPCFKPTRALDLMLFARKGPYQSTMDRGDIRIRRVPSPLSYLLAAELDRRIPLPEIYFSRQKVKRRWQSLPITDADGDVNTEFRDVVLKFAPSSGLKALAVDALGVKSEDVMAFGDIEPPPLLDEEGKVIPLVELGYAPFATAVGGPGAWNGAWPERIRLHVDHWATHEQGRKYAELDIVYTRGLHEHFGRPPLGDDDSELACMVGAVRWRGFKIDPDGIREIKAEAEKKVAEVPTAASHVKPWIYEKLTPEEIVAAKGSTKKTILEALMKQVGVRCEACAGKGEVWAEGLVPGVDSGLPCEACDGEGQYDHPAAERARLVLEARKGKYEINFYDKLLKAGRLHASFEVIGALSSRMAGRGGDLNAQGIKRDKYVREKFPLAWDGYVLCGGDFAGFEVVLAEAAYDDPDLRRDLLYKRPCIKCTRGDKRPECPRCKGEGVVDRYTEAETWCRECLSWHPKEGCDDCWGTGLCDTKIHALFGQFVYPDMTYDEIMRDKDKYTRCKSAVFAMLYSGEGYTLQDRLGVAIEVANAAHARFCSKYPGVGAAQRRIEAKFCTLRQDDLTQRITWSEPADYIESMFGFRRYFTLENKISKELFDLAQAPPSSWRRLNLRVTRNPRKGEQTAGGATQSALFGAAFALQASNKRAAGNHEIQSSGATVTKDVQRRIWDFQPAGVGRWLVIPINVHDEIMAPTVPELVDAVKAAVDAAVESYRGRVPLIKMEWSTHMESWAEK